MHIVIRYSPDPKAARRCTNQNREPITYHISLIRNVSKDEEEQFRVNSYIDTNQT